MQIKNLVLINFIIGAIIGIFLFIALDMRCVESYIAGVFLFNLNLVLLSLSWHLIIKKKLIALAAALIVLKYAILGISIYWSMHSSWVSPGWFVGGIANFTLAVLVAGFRERKNVI